MPKINIVLFKPSKNVIKKSNYIGKLVQQNIKLDVQSPKSADTEVIESSSMLKRSIDLLKKSAKPNDTKLPSPNGDSKRVLVEIASNQNTPIVNYNPNQNPNGIHSVVKSTTTTNSNLGEKSDYSAATTQTCTTQHKPTHSLSATFSTQQPTLFLSPVQRNSIKYNRQNKLNSAVESSRVTSSLTVPLMANEFKEKNEIKTDNKACNTSSEAIAVNKCTLSNKDIQVITIELSRPDETHKNKIEIEPVSTSDEIYYLFKSKCRDVPDVKEEHKPHNQPNQSVKDKDTVALTNHPNQQNSQNITATNECTPTATTGVTSPKMNSKKLESKAVELNIQHMSPTLQPKLHNETNAVENPPSEKLLLAAPTASASSYPNPSLANGRHANELHQGAKAQKGMFNGAADVTEDMHNLKLTFV